MRDFLKVYWPFMLIAFVGLIIALRFVEPAPPRTIVLAGGSPGGAYAAYAERYQRLLAEHNVTVDILTTAGAIENLRLLSEDGVDAALLQGGLANEGDARTMATLGGIFFEPLWVFVRREVGADSFGDLKTARVAIGAEGSGTRALALQIQAEFGTGWGPGARLPTGGPAAAEALRQGELDAAVFAADITAPYVEALIEAPDITLLKFERAAALSRRRPALAEITLLRGVVDIARDLPAEDIDMVAPVAQLAVDRDLHPAIQSILLEAASEIHAGGSLLAPAGTFPDPLKTDLPLSDEAARYYASGPTFLRRYLSFGLANFLERAWILLIPLVTLLIPLIRAAPPIYRWRVRRKIYIWYGDLRELEARGRAAASGPQREEVRRELARLQAEIGKLEVPLSYTDDLYRLRSHVAFVNQLLGNLDPKQNVAMPEAPGAEAAETVSTS